MNKKILIGPSSFAAMDSTPMEKLTKVGFKVVNNPFGRKLTKHELLELLPGVLGLIAGLETLDKEVMQKSDLKVISRCGAGLTNIDLKSAKDMGIKVCFTPDAPTVAVAELTVGAMLSLLRMIPLMDKELHEGRWTKKIGMQLEGKTVAIIGFGRIGRKVASLLGNFKVRILAVDPYLQGNIDDVPIVPLEQVLPQADIITLHCSSEACILGGKELIHVKPGAFLLNAARGGLVDEQALISALEENKIAGAWLDSFEKEPYTGPLTSYPQVILTPHVGSYSQECRIQMEMEAVENLINALKEVKDSKNEN